MKIEKELDRLYGLPLEDFTAARNELAAGLKREGDSASAAEVKRLSKPTLPAWTVNQLCRSEGQSIAALLEAGAALREAQQALLSGAGREELEAAAGAQRRAVSQLSSRARSLLAEAGRPATSATLERISATLRAASVDEEGRALLERGRLTADIELPGFEALGDVRSLRRKAKREKPIPAQHGKRERKEQLRSRRELTARLRELERAARTAEREAGRAEAEARAARQAADRAREQVEQVAGELRDLGSQ